MAFEATKREWSELYVFFRLLADGKVSLGTPQAKKEDEKYRPIAMIQREEHDGTRRYYIEEEVIRMEGEKVEKSIPREDFATVADLILDAIKILRRMKLRHPTGWRSSWTRQVSLIWKPGRRTVPTSRLLSGILKLRWRVSMSVRVSVR